MNFVDLFSLSLHRAVAEKMITNEAEVLRIARNNLERWLKSPSFEGVERFALLEWQNILNTYRPDEIRRIMTAETDDGQRLRSSSPFAGVLTRDERMSTWSACAEVGLN
jgi:hypothetical protein